MVSRAFDTLEHDVVGNRDEFTPGVKAVLANRAGFRCSKPSCRALTAGPSNAQPNSRTNIGVASHITAASSGGPRYDPEMSSEERRSVANGLWLCQTHAKEIDDDPVTFSAAVLRAWRYDAENEARALLGVPISTQSLDLTVQIALHRAEDNSLTVTGTTNLPDGTKLFVELHESRTGNMLGQVRTETGEGMFAAPGFMNRDMPHIHGWYTIVVLAYFNGAWVQSDAVLAIVGREGEYLVGRFAEPLHPEFADSEKRFRAEFECIAPPTKDAPERSKSDVERAIALTKQAILTINNRLSADPVQNVIAMFMTSPGLREHEGWSAESLPNGALVVGYSFWNGNDPAVAQWIVVLGTDEVRYWNLHGKYLSWSPDY